MLPDVLAAPLENLSGNSAASAALEPGDFIWCSVFSPRPADGNQSIVVRLDSWPEKTQLGAIARFLGTTETTFVVLKHNRLEIRWFAGAREVPLCGHCALAASSVLLPVLREGELLEVANLPSRLWLSRQGEEPYVVFRAVPLIEIPAGTVQIGVKLVKAFDAGRDYLLIVEDERALKNFDPKKAGLERLEKIGCILSSGCKSGRAAFRFFAPRAGIEEDRASGSVVPALMEYWAREQAGEQVFSQESGHGIKIRARWLGEKIALTGEVLQFARGTISSAVLEKIYSDA